MEAKRFELMPFVRSHATDRIAIAGEAIRETRYLSLIYQLTGDCASVVLPDQDTDAPERRDRLWEQTCFEFFLAAGPQHSRSSPYWEFNLSPAGHWNVFALTGYRQGLSLARPYAQLPFTLRRCANALVLKVRADIGALVPPSQPLLLGMSAVIRFESGEETFWAIQHPGPQADFHLPESFALAFEAAPSNI